MHTLNRRRSNFDKFAEKYPVLSVILGVFAFVLVIGLIDLLPSPAPVTVYRSSTTQEVKRVIDNKTGKDIPYDPKKHRVVSDNIWVR